MRDRITLKPDDSYRDNQAVVKFSYTNEDGEQKLEEITIEYALGSLENPMKKEHLDEKFRA